MPAPLRSPGLRLRTGGSALLAGGCTRDARGLALRLSSNLDSLIAWAPGL